MIYFMFRFLQVQLAEQKQELDKLRTEIENDYYQKCLLQQQLEQSLKEVMLWKYKALAVTVTNFSISIFL